MYVDVQAQVADGPKPQEHSKDEKESDTNEVLHIRPVEIRVVLSISDRLERPVASFTRPT